jgi:hypothetical protein
MYTSIFMEPRENSGYKKTHNFGCQQTYQNTKCYLRIKQSPKLQGVSGVSDVLHLNNVPLGNNFRDEHKFL